MKRPALFRRPAHKQGLAFDMFDLGFSAAEAKRLDKCQNIYHRGQKLAWNGTDILDMLVAEHGRPAMEDGKRQALQRIFAIILWGELAAWKISAQLADELVPLEAKMAATSQAHDEARHFYVMYDYLSLLGDVPKTLDPAPQRLLNLVLRTKNPAHKILGMQLMVETLALTIFQTVREAAPEPVLTELMKYFERDEARHVGLGMQYLPVLMRDMNKAELAALLAFQGRILVHGMWESKILEKDLEALGIHARDVMERGRAKQIAVLKTTFESLGLPYDKGPVIAMMSFAGELMFPTADTRASKPAQWRAAFAALRGNIPDADEDELAVHERHEIKTAQSSATGAARAHAVH